LERKNKFKLIIWHSLPNKASFIDIGDESEEDDSDEGE
jgi:hypothetical protein